MDDQGESSVNETENGDYVAVRPPDNPPLDPDDPAYNYPRQGHGLAKTLPPEEDDIEWLVDGDYEVYSHLYQTDPAKATENLLGDTFTEGAPENEEHALTAAAVSES